MSLLVVGSVAFDGIESPYGKVERTIGGAATYFSVAASFFTPVHLVGIVGDDFTDVDTKIFHGRKIDIEGLERAPGKSTRDMYLDAAGKPTRDSIEGWRSSGVPGSVRGFDLALTKYGRKKWADVMAPAIELASKGFPVSYSLAESLRSKNLSRSAESKRIYQKDGTFYEVDETIKLPDASTRTPHGAAALGTVNVD